MSNPQGKRSINAWENAAKKKKKMYLYPKIQHQSFK